MKKDLPESPFIFNFVVYYFVLFLIILFSFLYFTKIENNIVLNGKIKNYINYQKEYSDYEGVISSIYVKKEQAVKKGDKLYDIKIFDSNKEEKELKIKILKNNLLFTKDEIEKERIKNEIKILEEKNFIKTIYSSINGKINNLNIKKNNIVSKKELILEIIPENENNIFYIESKLDVNNSNNIKINQEIIYYFKQNNNLIKYKGSIFDIHKEVYIDNNNKAFFKFDSLILEKPNFELKEGFEVEVIITIDKKRLIDVI